MFLITESQVEPPLTLSLERFRDQVVPYEIKSNENLNNNMEVQLGNKYKEYLRDKVSEVKEVDNITTYVLDVAENSMDQYSRLVSFIFFFH